MSRTLVIGDIHGALKALIQVLERCGYNHKEDQLIFLGDYVDGWSESAELVEYLIQLKEEAEIKPIFIKGNHDAWCQEWLNTGLKKDMWVMQGGQATLDSYIKTGLLVKQEHRDFFNSLHNYYVDEENRGFVHGGFRSKNGLGHEAYESDYYWDRTLWEIAVAVHHNYIGTILEPESTDFDEFYRPLPYRFEKHKEVYIGHTSTTNWMAREHLPEKKYGQVSGTPISVPMNRCNVWNMDTGCGWNGRLSIMDIDTKEVWQSDFVKTLYPNEKGR